MTAMQRVPAPAVTISIFLRVSLCALMLSGLAAASHADTVGQVAELRPKFTRIDCNDKEKEPQELERCDLLKRDWCVATGGRDVGEPGPPGAVMSFNNGKVVGLGPDCQLKIERFEIKTNDIDPKRDCDMLWVCPKGKLLCQGERVRTLAAELQLVGTTFHLRVEADGSTEVAVFEGSARVESRSGGKSVVVDAGFRTFVEPGRRPTLPAPIDGDGVDRLRDIFGDSPWLDGPFDFEPLKSTGSRSFR